MQLKAFAYLEWPCTYRFGKLYLSSTSFSPASLASFMYLDLDAPTTMKPWMTVQKERPVSIKGTVPKALDRPKAFVPSPSSAPYLVSAKAPTKLAPMLFAKNIDMMEKILLVNE